MHRVSRGVSPHHDTRLGASYYAAQKASWGAMWHINDVAHATRVLAPRPGMTILECKLLRDILGPMPFRAVAVNPSWLAWNDAAVRKMAQAIYDDRAFDRLPILADALEDAGCDDPDILAHCRSGRGACPRLLGRGPPAG